MVFDASAIMAILGMEAGEKQASSHLGDGAVVSVVNAGEVIGKLVRRGVPFDRAVEAVEALDLTWVQPDPAQARRAGELGAVKNLSLADRFCIALGEARNEPLLTGDRDWAALDLRVPTELIR